MRPSSRAALLTLALGAAPAAAQPVLVTGGQACGARGALRPAPIPFPADACVRVAAGAPAGAGDPDAAPVGESDWPARAAPTLALSFNGAAAGPPALPTAFGGPGETPAAVPAGLAAAAVRRASVPAADLREALADERVALVVTLGYGPTALAFAGLAVARLAGPRCPRWA